MDPECKGQCVLVNHIDRIALEPDGMVVLARRMHDDEGFSA